MSRPTAGIAFELSTMSSSNSIVHADGNTFLMERRQAFNLKSGWKKFTPRNTGAAAPGSPASSSARGPTS